MFHDCVHRILAGDFNLVMDPSIDRLNSKHNHNKSLEILKTYMEQNDLCDIWRMRNPDKAIFTWHKDRKMTQASRIDMILISAGLINQVRECEICVGYKSDHSSPTVSLNFSVENRGKGTWKFNNLHLEQRDFTDLINDSINKVILDNRHHPPDIQWEMLKNALINTSIQYAIRKSKEKNKHMLALENEIQQLQANILESGDTLVYQEALLRRDFTILQFSEWN